MSAAHAAATIAALSPDPRLVRVARAQLEAAVAAETRYPMSNPMGPADTADTSQRAETDLSGETVSGRPGVRSGATYADAAPVAVSPVSQGRIETYPLTKPDGTTVTAHKDLDTGVVTYDFPDGATVTSEYDHFLSKPTYDSDETLAARGHVL